MPPSEQAGSMIRGLYSHSRQNVWENKILHALCWHLEFAHKSNSRLLNSYQIDSLLLRELKWGIKKMVDQDL